MLPKKVLIASLVILMLAVPLAAQADDDLVVTVVSTASCDSAEFVIGIENGSAPYTILLDFGDEESYSATDIEATSVTVKHTYPSQGEWEWKITIDDGDGSFGEAEGALIIAGPAVVLTSDPSPPLVTLDAGEATVRFSAAVTGGVSPYAYTWDLDGEGLDDAGLTGETANHNYGEYGEFNAGVTVSDACGLADTDHLLVVVIDPEEEPEKACHPTALKIAEAVTSIFPAQAEKTYTCEDILAIFEGEVFGFQVGFGRMWHAYQLTQVIDELTWEQIRDWQLVGGFGWGSLTQLNRFADTLEGVELMNLMERVLNGDNTLGDIRTAARAATRYEADFEDALERLESGFNSGELGQFYKLAESLGVDAEVIDGYMADGMSMSELKHSAKLAERMGADWTEVAEAKFFDHSWGEISQAYKLADDENSVEAILALGVKDFRNLQRGVAREEREASRSDKTAERIAERYGGNSSDDVLSVYNGECNGSWGCVRKHFRDQEQVESQGISDRDARTAQQIASKYGVSESEVGAQLGACSGDWNCVRAFFRNAARETRDKNKNK